MLSIGFKLVESVHITDQKCFCVKNAVDPLQHLAGEKIIIVLIRKLIWVILVVRESHELFELLFFRSFHSGLVGLLMQYSEDGMKPQTGKKVFIASFVPVYSCLVIYLGVLPVHDTDLVIFVSQQDPL